MLTESPNVLIVGAGPAGLAAAIALADAGVTGILVIDRDDAPGGLPRFCHHPGFGWEYARRLRTGPGFVRDLLAAAGRPGIRIVTGTTLIGIDALDAVAITGPATGHALLRPRAVILATGIRESNRGNLGIPGVRPERGIFTTGQLQQLVARGGAQLDHFRNLAVIGTEHVAFSALLTSRHGGARVRHMIGREPRILSFPAMRLMACLFGAEVHLGAELLEIGGSSDRVDALIVRQGDITRRIPCDGVVFSAGWIPETAAFAGTPLELDAASGGVAIDQAMRTSLPGFFAAGNVLRPVESSGWAACEGRRAGQWVAKYLAGALAAARGTTRLQAGRGVSYVVPQYWDTDLGEPEDVSLLAPSARAAADIEGRLSLRSAEGIVAIGRARKYRTARRIDFTLAGIRADAVLAIEGLTP